MNSKLILLIVVFILPLLSCYPKSEQDFDSSKIVSVWSGTFRSEIHTDGEIKEWILFEDGSMTGQWVTEKGSFAINMKGKYKIKDSKAKFQAKGLLVIQDETETKVKVVGKGYVYGNLAEGDFNIEIAESHYPNDKGTWSITRTDF